MEATGASVPAAVAAGVVGTGRRRERVRELLSAEDDQGSTSVRMETSIQDIPLQTNTDHLDYDSEDDHQHTGTSMNAALSTGQTDRAEGSIRVGTMLLSQQELQHAACLTTQDIIESNNMRSAFMQELLQGNKEGTGSAVASSAFAMALQARRQEASFGDELSD